VTYGASGVIRAPVAALSRVVPFIGGMKAYSHSWHTTHELKRRSGFSTRQKKVNFIRWWVDKENIGITTSSRLLTDKVFPTEKGYLEKYLESHSISPPQLNKHIPK